MAQIDISQRHLAIINFLRNRGKATFQEIKSYLQSNDDYLLDLSKRTFLRDIQYISSVYGIEILCDRKNGNTYSINEEVETDSISQYAMESLELFMALNTSTDLSRFIQLETRHTKGIQHIHPLLQAIRNKLVVEFYHQKFNKSQAELRKVYPLGLKESIGRWYLLAYCTKQKALRTFGLERISQLEATTTKFKYKLEQPVFSQFEPCFGIMLPEGNSLPQEVVLSFTRGKANYIKSYPFHHSQEILIDNEIELRIKLNIFTTHDFFIELLKHTGDIKILAPQELKQRYFNWLKIGLEMNAE